jgi:hypothetical protein|tara:strand:- start:246 stop:857 length:612 start_codon:yes stop_codon:yes gene_type:complete
MSQARNMKWLNERRVVYRQSPVNDIPDEETDKYNYYTKGTHEYYHLFNSKAKITTYKSLKWHFLVLYYLNKQTQSLSNVFRFIANKDNGFVTFFIKPQVLENMIKDVIKQGGEPPVNKMRKIIFKDYSGLTASEKMSIVGSLIGRSSIISAESIYQCMLDLNELDKQITWNKVATLLNCSERTIIRNINIQLKNEKKLLNEKI